jgi:hypothetical protein
MLGLWIAVGVLLVCCLWMLAAQAEAVARLRRWANTEFNLAGQCRNDLSIYCAGERAELRKRIEALEESDRMKGFDIKRLETDRESFAVDLASLRSLCETLCGELGHEDRELWRSDGEWDGDLWEPASVTYKCTRCGKEWTTEDVLEVKE